MVAKAQETTLVPVNVHGETTAVAGFTNVQSTRFNYVAFPKAGKSNWDELKSQFKDFEEYEPVLVRVTPGGNQFTRIATDMTFRCFWLGGYHFWGNFDINSGAVIAASLEPAEYPLIETVEGIVIVVNGNELVPAKISLRKGLCGAGITMEEAGARKVQTPEWLKENPSHAKIPPQYRFNAQVQVGIKISRREQSKGMPYPVAVSTRITPTDTAQVNRLTDAMSDKEFRDALQASIITYRERVREIESRLPAKKAS